MDLLGFEVEAQTATSEDLATDAGRWFVEVFGVVPRLRTYVQDLDPAATELAAKGIAAVPVDLDGDDAGAARGVRVVGPAGIAVDVVQPAAAGHHEARITEFIESAADLDGPSTEKVAGAVEEIVADAWRAIEGRLEGIPHNKVLAAQLLVSQRSRSDAPDDVLFWQRSAASTLLSWFVGQGASG